MSEINGMRKMVVKKAIKESVEQMEGEDYENELLPEDQETLA